MLKTTPLLLLVALGAALPASAQSDEGDYRAFVALRSTPVGALTPLLTPAMISRRLNGAQLGVRYSFIEEGNVRSQAFAGSGIFSVGMTSSVSLTAGFVDADCIDCSPALMLGAGGDMRVYQSGDVAGSGSGLSLAVSGDLGWGRIGGSDESALSIAIGAPLTLTFASTPGGMRIAPFFTPVFGIGSTSEECFLGTSCERNGIRWMLGGGVGVWNPTSSVTVALGVNRVMFEDSGTLFGLSVQLGGAR